MDIEDHCDIYARFVEIVKRGEPLPDEVSVLKILATETIQRAADLILETAGPAAQLHGRVPIGDGLIDLLGPFYKAMPASIYGGSNEIQRNILAKNVLHL
jgi:hypothetical protein